MDKKKDKIGVVIQARMGSERLPGKVLLKVCDKPLLSHLLERLARVKNIDDVILATTTLNRDIPIVFLAEERRTPVYRGSEENVLERTYKAALEHNLDVVIRITSDCPLIDPKIVEECVEVFKSKRVDYLSNTLEKNVPRGMDVEIFRIEALEDAYMEATASYDKEHVTPFIKKHPERFSLYSLKGPVDLSHYRLTLDTPEDFRLINAIFEELYPKNRAFGLEDILGLLRDHSDWLEWNRDIQQKN